MKSILLLIALCSAAYAQIPNAIRSSQNGPTGAGNFISEKPYPTTGSRGLLVYNPDTSPPSAHMTVWGSEFEWNTGTPNVLNLSSAMLATINGKQDQIPAGIATEYYRGDKTWAAFPSNVSTFTNDSGYITSAALSPYLTSATAASTYATQAALASGLSGKQDSLGFTPYNASNPSGFVTQAGARSAISLTTTGTSGAATYNSSTGVLNVPQYSSPARSFATPARTLNTAFQIDASRDAFVSYTVDVATSLTLTGGATGTVTLQYADDLAFTTGIVTVQSSVNGNTGALTIGLSLTQTSTAALTGMVPAGKYVRISTANTAGTPTFTYRAAQEVKL